LFFGIGFAFIPDRMMYEQTSIIAIILFALPAFIGLIKWLGYKQGLLLIALLGIFSLAIETIGLYTGFPYSEFEYGMPIGTKLFNTTPWTVFFAWSPFVIGAFAIAKKRSSSVLKTLMMSIIILLLFDLVLEPAAIARGLWTYTKDGFWYSAPLTNYLGWIFSGSIATVILYFFTKKNKLKEITFLQSSLLYSLALWSGANLGFGFIFPSSIGVLVLMKILL